jgi:YesN/AraC family two-component response regulator
LVGQVAQASEIDTERLDLVNCFCKQDLNLQHIAMLLLAELRSGGMMGQLYVESLTQVLVIHLLQHYSKSAQIITSLDRSLTRTQLQQAIDYIHAHLDRDLSLVQIAEVINISPTSACQFVQTRYRYFSAPVRDSTASGTGEIAAVENGFGDRGHCITSGFLQSKPFDATV